MWLRIASGQARGEAVEVGDDPLTIGSGEGCALRVVDADVAPLHASVRRGEDGEPVVVALSAEHPVLVDGQPVERATPLRAGSELQLAGVRLEATDRRPADPEASARHHLLDEAVEEVEGPEDVEPVAGVRRRLRLATALAGAALALAVVFGGLALGGVFGGGGDALPTAQVVERARPATVRVDVLGPDMAARGSGWVLDAGRGLVVTNFHVINGGQEFRVVGAGGSTPARVVAAAPCDDTAVLRTESSAGLRTLALGVQRDVRPGDPVVALGFPANASRRPLLTSTAGVVSVVRAALPAAGPSFPELPNMLQTDAAINPGNSGGPLLDDQARLVGMNAQALLAAGGEPVQGEGYAIGVDRLKELLPDLRRGRSLGWPGFGINVASPRFLASHHLPAGVIAGPAAPGTAADRSGLGSDQVLLVGVDGKPVGSRLSSYCKAVRGVHGPVDVQVITRPGARPRKVRLSF